MILETKETRNPTKCSERIRFGVNFNFLEANKKIKHTEYNMDIERGAVVLAVKKIIIMLVFLNDEGKIIGRK